MELAKMQQNNQKIRRKYRNWFGCAQLIQKFKEELQVIT